MTCEEYESGPFCIHWGDPGDCDSACLRKGCGHRCSNHGTFDDPDSCQEEGCSCPGLIYERDGEYTDIATGKEVAREIVDRSIK